ncbi:AraC family transcriptional regulator [Paenibacillus sp. FSL R7-0273]|uniref:response regulator transcription factor n=1 Tax=Paenibacillus sp. FSL R7-0273 TaxID=1536772 RepID=UPI0004F6B26E|nr:response regulator [Paenibacillus sp. FSL R7-0273]AIQ48932.1 AraC family transcriptional regulator [Paenibacillus sp. FSL R7-0273]OMF91190.1 DNA-binding response regulator [Paenibacillus sp. FSL R7-0273]
MYRVMLIDDDIPMLKVLQQMINWEELDLHVAGSTYSSAKALHIFRETQPDIVITDIGLPKKSGIELAAEFTAMKPDVRIIFLTCHEDFHYAQAAVRLDADDYLLKDKLSAEQLEASLRKSVSRLKSGIAGSQLESMPNNGGLLRRALLQMIVDGADLERVRPHAARLGISWSYPWFMMGIVNLRYCAYEPFYNRSNLPLIRYAVYNIALEIAESYEGITPFIEQEQFIILYNYRHNLAGNDAAYFHSYLEELIAQSSAYLKLTLQIVAVSDRLALQAAGAVYQQIRLGRPEFYSAEQLVMAPCGQLLENMFYPAPQGFADPFRYKLEQAILEKEVEAIRLVLEQFGQEALSRRTEPEEWIGELIQLMRGAEVLFARRKPDEDIYYYLGEARTAEDTLGLAFGRMEQLVREQGMYSSPVPASEPRLQVIQAFIDQHLTENITSIDIAQYLYLNPSYFSRYFKRLTGLSFTDYVHQYKMKIAANMLKNSSQTLEMLAMGLGYSDRAYFSKVFKKYIGVTPSDYKQKKQLRRTP